LAGGDILKIDKVTDLKITQAFTFLCYELDLDILKRNNTPKQ
tara:strand:+ start:8787 stop:8912 length:126 start_codon:yes stop_codon:yes gene_type:complete